VHKPFIFVQLLVNRARRVILSKHLRQLTKNAIVNSVIKCISSAQGSSPCQGGQQSIYLLLRRSTPVLLAAASLIARGNVDDVKDKAGGMLGGLAGISAQAVPVAKMPPPAPQQEPARQPPHCTSGEARGT
jgi:hypothetical protein